jgi:hypothetical protein
MNYFGILIDFLRDRPTFLEEIQKGIKLERKIFAFLICNSIFFAIYGGIIGSFHPSGLQILSSAVKLPALYLLTSAICLPTLYFFDIISSSKFKFSQYVTLILAALSLVSVMLFGFAPIALFFRISGSDYNFFMLLNLVILAIAGIIGINFFYRAILSLPLPNQEIVSSRKLVIRSWMFLYGFVGSQLGWTLRPFFGDPDSKFSLFRPLESNFYLQVLKIISNLLGFQQNF